MNNIGAIDIGVIFIYCLSFIVVGVLAGKRVKGSKDFTTAGQGMSLKLVVGSTVATCMGASIMFSNYELLRNSGMSAFPAILSWNIGWLVLVLMSKRLRASGASTIPGFLEQRYNGTTRKYSSLFILLMGISSTAAQFLAIGTMCNVLGICDTKTGTIVGAAIIVLFTIFSGLWGVAITDTIQSVILVIGCAIVIPIVAFHSAGGVGHVFANTDPASLSLTKNLTFQTMLGYVLANVLACGAHPAYSQRSFAAKDGKTAARGQLIACIICAIVTVVAALPAFTMPFLFPGMTNGAEFTPLLIVTYFPVVIKGVLMAAMVGLLLTTGDTFLLLLSSTLTEDIIRPIAPKLDDKKMLTITRATVLISSVVIVILALSIKSIFELFKLGGSAYGAAVFFPLLLGCYWKGAKTKAINAAMLTAGLLSFIWDLTFKNSTGISGVTLGAAACLAICVLGSLLTRKTEAVQVKEGQ